MPHRQVDKLHRFADGKNGGNPYGPLITDQNGDIYGSTGAGGISGYGVVFELSPNSDGTWSDSTLHGFQGSDGARPLGSLTMDAQGNIYGTTFSGGTGAGVAFELSPQGNKKWSYALLYQFGGPDSPTGSNPNGGLVFDSNGNAYGTTQLGGDRSCTGTPGPCGLVYELSPAKPGGWTETVLYSFGGRPDGAYPYSPLVFDSAGNLYGTTSEGGTGKCNDGEGDIIGCGTVFKLSPAKSGWTESVLYNFTRHEFGEPGAPLVFTKDGSLYSTAGYDVFRVKPSGRAWKKSTIYEFSEGIAGTIPSGGVVFDPSGNLYGTTASSGLEGYSTVFKLSPPMGDAGTWTERSLARFGRGFSSNQPRGGILIGSDGTLYGATSGSADRGYVFAVRR